MTLGDLTATLLYLYWGYQEDGDRLFTVVCGGCARDNVHKWKQEVLSGYKQRLSHHEDSQAVPILGGLHDQTG